MTIPSRPAPPPPTNNVVGNNNNNNLSHYQRQHQQNGGVVVPKLTIKLPPPPTKGVQKGGTGGVNYASSSSIYRSNSNNSLTSNGVTNSSSLSSSSSSITRKFPMANVRYAPTTNWDGSPFEPTMVNGKKAPPPRTPPPKRPPPPKINNGHTTPPTQSVNILSNIFGRKKSTKAPKRPSQRPGVTVSASSHSNLMYGTNTGSLYSSFSSTTLGPSATSSDTNVQLISFDSPPSSPTFTQKSNSDCVSVDSFSSDSNFSSPNNGSVSQPESGFEDDFSSSRATTSPLDPWDTFTNSGGSELTTLGSAPVRNYNVVNNRIQQNSDNQLCNGKSLLPPPSVLHMPTIIKPKISQKPKAPKPPPTPMTLEQIRYDLAVGGGNKSASNGNSDEAVTPPSPPMPNCPPPPPPPGGFSILDVIKGNIDAMSLGTHYDDSANEQPYGIALYEFDGAVEGDLSFRENEKIYILEKLNDEWLRGRNRSGCEGIFPTNYIDIKVPLKDNNRDISRTTTTSQSASTVTFSSSSSSSSYTHHEKKEVITNGFAGSAKTTNTNINNSNRVRCLYTFDAGEPGDLVFQENDYVTVLYRINEDWLFGETPDGRQGQFPANFLEYIPDNIPMP